MSTKRECPSCRSVYTGDDKMFCPKDGTRLLEAAPPKPPADNFVGRVIANRFVLESRIGKGGMGVVYLANHTVLKRRFAVKLLRREFVSNERALARFFREARVASSVDHPNIVSIYDYGQTDQGEPYLVMEYVEGTVLYNLMQQSRTRNLHPAYAVHILVQVARALEHAHARGVVHRDIKPENILLSTWNGQPDFVKVLDFGIARLVGQPPLTRIGEEIIGTPEFIAPEMLGSADVAPPVDLYSLGIMLHDTVVGEPPFRGDVRVVLQGHMNIVPPRLSERRRDVTIPIELDEVTAQLLEKDAAKRPTAAEAVVRLEQILSLMPTRAAHSQMLAGNGPDATAQHTPVKAHVFDGTHTLIIGPEQRGDDQMQGAATMVLPASAAGPISERFAAIAKVHDPSVRAEIEALESEIDIGSLRLSQQVEKLAVELWKENWPEHAAELRSLVSECQKSEEQRGLRLAMLQEQGQQQLQRLDQQRQALRQRILSLSERLQLEPGMSAVERDQLVQSIAESEQSLATVLQTVATSPEPEMYTLRKEMRELQNAARHGYNELARLVLAAAAPIKTHEAACLAIEQVQQQIEAAKSMLTLLTRKS